MLKNSAYLLKKTMYKNYIGEILVNNFLKTIIYKKSPVYSIRHRIKYIYLHYHRELKESILNYILNFKGVL